MAAELCRRGLLATPFAGNVPHYDVIASGQRGGHLAIQVKAINKGGAWQFNIQRFLSVRLNLAAGATPEELLTDYPTLPKEAIPAALAYAANLARDSIVPVTA